MPEMNQELLTDQERQQWNRVVSGQLIKEPGESEKALSREKKIRALWSALHAFDVRGLYFWIKAGAEVNVCELHQKMNPLDFAIQWGRADMVKILVEADGMLYCTTQKMNLGNKTHDFEAQMKRQLKIIQGDGEGDNDHVQRVGQDDRRFDPVWLSVGELAAQTGSFEFMKSIQAFAPRVLTAREWQNWCIEHGRLSELCDWHAESAEPLSDRAWVSLTALCITRLYLKEMYDIGGVKKQGALKWLKLMSPYMPQQCLDRLYGSVVYEDYEDALCALMNTGRRPSQWRVPIEFVDIQGQDRTVRIQLLNVAILGSFIHFKVEGHYQGACVELLSAITSLEQQSHLEEVDPYVLAQLSVAGLLSYRQRGYKITGCDEFGNNVLGLWAKNNIDNAIWINCMKQLFELMIHRNHEGVSAYEMVLKNTPDQLKRARYEQLMAEQEKALLAHVSQTFASTVSRLAKGAHEALAQTQKAVSAGGENVKPETQEQARERGRRSL